MTSLIFSDLEKSTLEAMSIFCMPFPRYSGRTPTLVKKKKDKYSLAPAYAIGTLSR